MTPPAKGPEVNTGVHKIVVLPFHFHFCFIQLGLEPPTDKEQKLDKL